VQDQEERYTPKPLNEATYKLNAIYITYCTKATPKQSYIQTECNLYNLLHQGYPFQAKPENSWVNLQLRSLTSCSIMYCSLHQRNFPRIPA